MPAAPEEPVRLMQHAPGSKAFPKDFEIPCFQRPRVLLDLPKIRIDLVLSDLVSDNRLGGDQSASGLANLHFLHAGAVLDLDLLRVAAVLSGSLSGKDHVVILVHGAGAVGLDVSSGASHMPKEPRSSRSLLSRTPTK